MQVNWMVPFGNRPSGGSGGPYQPTGPRRADRLRQAARSGWELVFPPTCANCGEDLPEHDADHLFCPMCLAELSLFSQAVCRRCGGSVEGGIAGQCQHCQGQNFQFDEAIAMGSYRGLLRDVLLRMKSSRGDQLSLSLGQLLWNSCSAPLQSAAADVVAPVPIHWWRRLRRGTNSAALLAEVLADRLKLPLATDLLRRHRSTIPQSALGAQQRVRNLRGALVVPTCHILRQGCVLLVDDVLTTGATANEAARVLKAAGAERVVLAVAARSHFAT